MSTIATLALVMTVSLACALAGAQNDHSFKAERAIRTGRFTVKATPQRAFPLFTPLGEKHWAKGWNPEVLYPADGHPVEGLLFKTNDHGGMYWWMTRYDPEQLVVEYHAVVPEAFGRNIRVECKAVGNRTEVVVTDTYVGLSEHGNQFIRSLDVPAYQKKMKGWEEPINRWLTTGEEPK